MELHTAFQETWNEVEIAFKDAQIRNHEVFVFTFCSALKANTPELHAIYDARLITDQGHRPNLFIWVDNGEPTVVFIGMVKFETDSLEAFGRDIKGLSEYVARPLVEVLSGHDSTELLAVSPNVEFGYFVISDLTSTTIKEGVASLGLSQRELTRFHFAYGSVNGHSHFEYQEPQYVE